MLALSRNESIPLEPMKVSMAFDWETFPSQKAEGYRHIMVNGEVTFEDGNCTSATPGKLLRGGQAA